jgi:hypothetical protein
VPPHPVRIAVALTLAVSAPLAAQQAVPPAAAGRGTIVGIVVDTTGRPVDNAQLLLVSPRRQAITNRDGTFRLNDVGTGKADLTVRKIGHHPVRAQFEIADSGSVLQIEMIPLVRSLPTVITTAQREGLSGVITDTDYRPLAGATVRAVASGAGTAKTDTAGQFFSPVKPGHHFVEVNAAGYLSQLVSVTIPNGEGRRIAVMMRAGLRTTVARQAAYMDAMRSRITNRRTAYSRLFTREDIAKWNVDDVRQLATIGAMARIDESCEVIIDGGLERMPIWAIDVESIEFMEVYASAPQRREVRSMSRGATARMGARTSSSSLVPCPASIFVWLRQ